jgi:hypothetical protein
MNSRRQRLGWRYEAAAAAAAACSAAAAAAAACTATHLVPCNDLRLDDARREKGECGRGVQRCALMVVPIQVTMLTMLT